MTTGRQVFPGVYRATVTNNKDPKKQRRLQVELTTSVGHSTEWIWPMEPANISTEVPDIGQGVWVHFQAGDHEYPVWFGVFGKHKGKSKRLYVKALLNSVNISNLTSYIKTKKQPDGTTEIDLMDTLIAMANKLKDHETRIVTLEGKSHTH
jgi:Type VI secretion system/phage-baseplate injector OB domain